MTGVDLHPEQLFDALRAGTLGARERARLEAHCARCPACLFELRWLDSPGAFAEPTAADRAYGEAAFDNVLRATKRVQDVPPAPARWPLRWGLGGLLLGTGLSVALFLGRSLWAATAAPVVPPEASVSSPNVSAPPIGDTIRVLVQREANKLPTPPQPTVQDSEPAPTVMPTANALLAAARKAQTQRQLGRAQQLYRRVIATYPTTAASGAARVALGRLFHAQLTQPRAALRLFDDYLRQYPRGELVEEALYYRALSLEQLGHKRQAEANLRELLTTFPDSLYAASARARLVHGHSE